MSLTCTEHATSRLRQRGTPNDVLKTLLDWGDISVPVGGGASSISISNARLREMASEGVNRQMLERLKGRAAIVGSDGAVITYMSISSSGNRRYRHGIN